MANFAGSVIALVLLVTQGGCSKGPFVGTGVLQSAKRLVGIEESSDVSIVRAGVLAIGDEFSITLNNDLISAGLSLEQATVISSGAREEMAVTAGNIAVTELRLTGLPDALFLATPSFAKGALKALRKAGLSDDLLLKASKAILQSTTESAASKMSSAQTTPTLLQAELVKTAVTTINENLPADITARSIGQAVSGSVQGSTKYAAESLSDVVKEISKSVVNASKDSSNLSDIINESTSGAVSGMKTWASDTLTSLMGAVSGSFVTAIQSLPVTEEMKSSLSVSSIGSAFKAFGEFVTDPNMIVAATKQITSEALSAVKNSDAMVKTMTTKIYTSATSIVSADYADDVVQTMVVGAGSDTLTNAVDALYDAAPSQISAINAGLDTLEKNGDITSTERQTIKTETAVPVSTSSSMSFQACPIASTLTYGDILLLDHFSSNSRERVCSQPLGTSCPMPSSNLLEDIQAYSDVGANENFCYFNLKHFECSDLASLSPTALISEIPGSGGEFYTNEIGAVMCVQHASTGSCTTLGNLPNTPAYTLFAKTDMMAIENVIGCDHIPTYPTCTNNSESLALVSTLPLSPTGKSRICNNGNSSTLSLDLDTQKLGLLSKTYWQNNNSHFIFEVPQLCSSGSRKFSWATHAEMCLADTQGTCPTVGGLEAGVAVGNYCLYTKLVAQKSPYTPWSMVDLSTNISSQALNSYETAYSFKFYSPSAPTAPTFDQSQWWGRATISSYINDSAASYYRLSFKISEPVCSGAPDPNFYHLNTYGLDLSCGMPYAAGGTVPTATACPSPPPYYQGARLAPILDTSLNNAFTWVSCRYRADVVNCALDGSQFTNFENKLSCRKGSPVTTCASMTLPGGLSLYAGSGTTDDYCVVGP